MKQRKLLIFLLLLFVAEIAYAATMKRIDVGKLQARIFDDGIQSGTNLPMSHCKYKRGYYNVAWDDELTNTYWPGGFLRQAAILVGNRNWVDTLGNFWPYNVTGHCANSSTVTNNPYQFNVPDESGFTIKRIFSYPPPEIIVDGLPCEPPWGELGDEVAPEKVWGTADVMVECHWRLSNGMDVYQRNLAWSQPELDDVVFWDLTFVNTGNVNRNDDIELPGQTLDSVVIMRHYEALPNGGLYPWGTWAGVTENDTNTLSYPLEHDSLRINYLALARKAEHTHDSYGDKCEKDWGGDVNLEDGCGWTGHVILFAPKNTSVPQTYPIADIAASNDPAQPSMHSTIEGFAGVLYDVEDMLDSTDHEEPYRCMRMGIHGYEDTAIAEVQNVYDMSQRYDVYDTTAMGAPTYYDQPQDRMGELALDRGQIFPRTWQYYTFTTLPKFSIGPYNMEYLDTLRFVFAIVAGSVHRKTTYLLSEARADGQARNYEWVAGMDSATIREEYEKRDPVAELYGDNVYMEGGLNEIATDYVISTGKDSLLYNGMAARRAFNLNYEIPASPNPPSFFRIGSRDDMIVLTWTYEPGFEPADLAGFKIYRALGATLYEKSGESVQGDWQLIDSVGPADTLYGDTLGVIRGYDYYYSITAVSSTGIESGKWMTMSIEPFAARLLDPIEPNLDLCRVVPNPLNIRDPKQRMDDPNKITFRRLTEKCTIRIFTESGELMKTLKHDGGGTEVWQIIEEGGLYLTTVNNQRPASGLYIAHIQDDVTGEAVFRKFIIIR